MRPFLYHTGVSGVGVQHNDERQSRAAQSTVDQPRVVEQHHGDQSAGVTRALLYLRVGEREPITDSSSHVAEEAAGDV